jgi:hypothetical protein
MILITGNGPNKRNTLRDIGNWFGGQPVSITIDPGTKPEVVSTALQNMAKIIFDASQLQEEEEETDFDL